MEDYEKLRDTREVIPLTRKMYEGTVFKMIHEGQLSESFKVKTGVRQGCLLSSYLFILAVALLMKEATTGIRT